MIGFSPACERNKEPILAELRIRLAQSSSVLEIGSGTGQHAVHFARHLPHLRWQPTERAIEFSGLAERIAEEGPPNLAPPLLLDVAAPGWPSGAFDAAFTANTLHIMGWADVERCFIGIGALLPAGSPWLTYGPFMLDGRHTSPSNERFDAELRAADPRRGLRDVAALSALGARAELRLEAQILMPVNNRLLVWRRSGDPAF